MQLTIDTTALRPSTIATMIADMLEARSPHNNAQIKALIAHLEILVGEDESIEFLVNSGVTPEQLVEMWQEDDAALAPDAQDFRNWTEWQTAIAEWRAVRNAWDAEVAA